MPLHSYDLIAFLDKRIALPQHYQPSDDLHSHIQVGGMRSLIDFLLEWKKFEEEGDEDEGSDDPSGSITLNSDDGLPSVLGNRRVLGPSVSSIQVDIGDTVE